MEWELSKEIVQPLKAGRNVEVLNDALKAKAAGPGGTTAFEQQRGQFLAAVENYVGEDPLAPWIPYINWIRDACPAGGPQSELVNLLERCTRNFQDDERYRGDRRYLLIWMQYADCCSDPSDVFAFLENNDIGHDYAIFYRTYAMFAELRGNVSKADEIYRLGIKRSAQPLGILKSMYKTFLNRMCQRGDQQHHGEQLPLAENWHDENDVRLRSFGSTVGSSGDGVGRRSSHSRAGTVASAPPRRTAGSSNPLLSVYADPECRDSSDDSAREGSGKLGIQQVAWRRMGSEAERKKENVQLPVRWSDAQIRQKACHQVGRQSTFNIFVDDEFEEDRNFIQ